jgi:hypothetical protein
MRFPKILERLVRAEPVNKTPQRPISPMVHKPVFFGGWGRGQREHFHRSFFGENCGSFSQKNAHLGILPEAGLQGLSLQGSLKTA